MKLCKQVRIRANKNECNRLPTAMFDYKRLQNITPVGPAHLHQISHNEMFSDFNLLLSLSRQRFALLVHHQLKHVFYVLKRTVSLRVLSALFKGTTQCLP